MNQESLITLGWNPFFQRQLTYGDSQNVSIARVSAHFGSQILLLGSQGEVRVPVQLAEAVGEVTVGDWLVLDANDSRALQRLERQSLVARKAAGEEVKPQLIAANIDTIFIVSSCNLDFNLSRMERYLALVLQADIVPVVVLTKADLHENPAGMRRSCEQLYPGLLVETLDARRLDETTVLRSWCGPGQSVALLGSSGVGKSTLANALGAEHLKTASIREDDAKGRHTTTSRSLHLLPSGGVLVDNPGMRELQLPACEEGVSELFDDVLQIAALCRFNNCNHDGDDGCAIEEALASGELDERRFHSFMKLDAEQAHNSRSLAERRRKDRHQGRFYKSVIADKRRRRDLE